MLIPSQDLPAREPAPSASSIIIVAAHADDEAIGLGAHLRDLRELAAIIHVTDGAPRTGDDVRNAGCGSWEEYAALRRLEFERALAASGAHSRNNLCLQCPDQQASFRIAALATRLVEIFELLQPVIVFTHPYEGGHPDHDAAAAAVHAARRLTSRAFEIFEFSSYHAAGAGMACECFLENGPLASIPRPLSEVQRERKRQMFGCYQSQKRVLDQFPLKAEPIRTAPEYDFTQPPHQGTLFYERFSWGITGTQWRVLASRAFRKLRLH